MREHALAYGAHAIDDKVSALSQSESGFSAQTSSRRISGRKFLIATGLVDKTPSTPGLETMIYSGTLRLCPVCDGYEVIGKNVAVLGPAKEALKKALFLRTYTEHLTLLATDPVESLSEEERRRMWEAGIRTPTGGLSRIDVREEGVTAAFDVGQSLRFDVLYPAMGCHVRAEIADGLGVERNDAGCVVVDAHQRTNVPGLYAAGDVAEEMNQITVAYGQATVAATDMHNTIAEEDGGRL